MTKRRTAASAEAQTGAPMWLIGLIIVAIVGAVGIVLALVTNRPAPFTPEVTGAARAAVDVTSVDHGTVAFDVPVESIYRIRNVGDRPLNILGEPRVELVEGC